jgi:hypothetical protein
MALITADTPSCFCMGVSFTIYFYPQSGVFKPPIMTENAANKILKHFSRKSGSKKYPKITSKNKSL